LSPGGYIRDKAFPGHDPGKVGVAMPLCTTITVVWAWIYTCAVKRMLWELERVLSSYTIYIR
jgi:hypothetical protein